MAEPRRSSGRLALTLAALTATIGGWLAMIVREEAPSTETPSPALEPPPDPVAITRSSR